MSSRQRLWSWSGRVASRRDQRQRATGRGGVGVLGARPRPNRCRGLDEGSKATLQELADEYGVSAERIRQIEAGAMKKMKALLLA